MPSSCEDAHLGYSSLDKDAQEQGSPPVNSDVTERLNTKRKRSQERRGRGGSEKRISERNKNKETDLVGRGRVAPTRHFLM